MEDFQSATKPSRWASLSLRIKLGIILIVVANLFLGSILLVPFIEVSLSHKGSISFALFVIGEILFYLGLFLLGKEMAQKYRKYLNPLNWFKKKDNYGN